jgi:exodeoxyribonuclease V
MASNAALKLFSGGIEFSIDQQQALDAVWEWRANWPASNQYFTLAGNAGTGKTSLISELLKGWRKVAVVAPTGKAVNRLKQCGVDDASTIHGLIYRPYEDDEGVIHYKKVQELENIDTIVCDEASMVNQWLFNDLLCFGKPILFVGDHGQLEPIGKDPQLMHEPDVKLEKIHRQAENNPIIRLASAWREGRESQVIEAMRRKGYWEDADGKCLVTSKREFEKYIDSGMQLVCGFNGSRHRLNKLIRAKKGLDSPTPQAGDKLICLRNNKDFGIFNGQQATCVTAFKPGKKTIELEIELDDGRVISAPCKLDQFGNNTIEDHKNQEIALFDYAYCITAHKSQGSEWATVAVLEEISNMWDARRWRYTATTRAKERLVYCL